MKNYNSFKPLMTIIVILFMLNSISAQMHQGWGQGAREDMEAKRIAYITHQLSLTPNEALTFWPVYNEYNAMRTQMMNKHRKQRSDISELESKSQNELVRIAEQDILNMEEMTALRRSYHEKFMEILPAIKVIRLYQAERDFNRELFRESRRKGRAGRGRN